MILVLLDEYVQVKKLSFEDAFARLFIRRLFGTHVDL